MKKIIGGILLGCICLSCKTQQPNIAVGKKVDMPELSKELIKAPSLVEIISPLIESSLPEKKSSKISDTRFQNGQITEIVNDTMNRKYSFQDNLLTGIYENFEDRRHPIVSGGLKRTLSYKTNLKYYPNGQLNEYRVFMDDFNSRYMEVGTWYLYDIDGTVLQTIDHEKHYTMSYFEIIEIADKYIGPYTFNYDITYYVITRNFNDTKSYWTITMRGPMRHTRVIIIDDKSGDIVFDKLDSDSDFNTKSNFEFPEYKKHLYEPFWKNIFSK